MRAAVKRDDLAPTAATAGEDHHQTQREMLRGEIEEGEA